MADDQDPLLAMLANDGVEQTSQTQQHVAPAFSAGWPEIELADMSALLAELGILLLDAELGQPIEHAEFLFAQAFVRLPGQPVRDDARGLQDQLCRLSRSHVRR